MEYDMDSDFIGKLWTHRWAQHFKFTCRVHFFLPYSSLSKKKVMKSISLKNFPGYLITNRDNLISAFILVLK